MSTFVQIQGLRKRYAHDAPFAVGPQEAGLNLNINTGEIFSLLGPNGAGKTTTISMISTLLTPTAGQITIGGHDVKKNPVEAKQLIGVVPQEIALYPTLTARQNLEFFGRMYGLGGKPLKERVTEVLEVIDLADRADERIENYSGGMKRRVNIGVGLIHKPKMVFLDEPTVGIDPQSRRKILDTVLDLNKQGMTVLYTTHYMEEAEELSHRIGIIDHGEIIALGSLGELTQKIGEKDTLILKVGGAVEPSALERLRGLEGVDAVDYDGETETLRVIAGRGRKVLPLVIGVTNELGLSLQSVKIEEPNLEAVFLHMTGRALRD
ncbi:MAG: ATP-binding cassette domain-containing protein [Anaerolineales bacterium]|nr:ATP-binding cassette domain-containing protein [Anaerolineales bacterium]